MEDLDKGAGEGLDDIPGDRLSALVDDFLKTKPPQVPAYMPGGPIIPWIVKWARLTLFELDLIRRGQK